MTPEFQDYIKEKNRELYDVILEDLRGGHIALFRLIDEFANQSKWISVEDRLPLKLNSHSSLLTEDVLAFDKTTETLLIGWYSFKSAKWHCEEDIILNITHWMQLPEKP